MLYFAPLFINNVEYFVNLSNNQKQNNNQPMKTFLLLVSFFVCSLMPAFAQKPLPKWTKNPTGQGKTVAMGDDHDDAYEIAIGQLYDSFDQRVDTSSLVSKLMALDSTLVIDQRTSWVEAAMNSGYFKVKDSLETDTSYWVNVQVTSADLKNFVESLTSSNKMFGSESLTRARFSREQGDLLSAVQQYAKGLNEVLPSMHRPLPTDVLQGADLARTIFDEYIITLDSVQSVAGRETCPMVKGEAIPVELTFRFTSHDGKNIPNMPVKAGFEGPKGQVTLVSKFTDRDGLAKVRVMEAPQTDEAEVWAAIDEDALYACIPDNVAKQMLYNRTHGTFPRSSIKLVAFDPTPTFTIAVDSLEEDHKPALANLLKKHGFLAEPGDNADLELTLEYQNQLQVAPEKHGDYMLATYRCGLTLKIQVRATKEVLLEYKIRDFDLLQPADKPADKVRRRAVGEMMKQVNRELPERLSEVNYDKRKVVFK